MEIGREGAVLTMPENENLSWKCKLGSYDTSTYWTKFNEDDNHDSVSPELNQIIKAVIELARAKAPEKPKEEKKENKPKKQVNEADLQMEETIKTLMIKEISHHDWKGDFEELNKKMESMSKNEKKKAQTDFFNNFTAKIVEKVKVEEPAILEKKNFVNNVVMKNINGMLRN